MGIPGPAQLAVVLAIVVVIFGTKRLRQAGGDLGAAIKGVKDGIKGDEELEEQFSSLTNKATESVVSEINKAKSKVI